MKIKGEKKRERDSSVNKIIHTVLFHQPGEPEIHAGDEMGLILQTLLVFQTLTFYTK